MVDTLIAALDGYGEPETTKRGSGLVQELGSVSQHEHAIAGSDHALRHCRERHRLAEPGREHEQC